MNRSVVLPLIVDGDKKIEVRNSIDLFRAACRKAYSACALAEMAGAEIMVENEAVKVKPSTTRAKKLLEEVYNIKGKKAHLHELRKWLRELHPSWKSIVPESVHIAVSERWRAPDPEFPKAKRGYLTLNGARAFANFRRRGITLKHKVPKLEPHGFRAKWDFEIGEVKFRFAKMDSSRHYIWRCLYGKVEGWKCGTIYLKHDDGKLSAVVTYTCPDPPKELDPTKTLYIECSRDPQNLITAHTDDRWSGEIINGTGVLAWLSEKEKVYQRYVSQLASFDMRQAKKQRKGLKKRINVHTCRRKDYEQTSNHTWTRRLAEIAKRKQAGNVVVLNLPEKTLGEYPWAWAQFKKFLNYKIGDIGGTVKYVKSDETVQKLSEAVSA